jgi:peptide-N-glycosidase F-like protein
MNVHNTAGPRWTLLAVALAWGGCASQMPQPAPAPQPTPDPGGGPPVGPPVGEPGAPPASPDAAAMSPADAPPAPPSGPPVVMPPGGPGPDTTVAGVSGVQMYYVSGMDNKRTLDAPVQFPAMPLTYERITLNFALRCPATGGCDAWDRRGFIGVVHSDGTTQTVTEILRFMTPYRVGATWSVDVTELRPLLAGAATLRVFIDTWVGPGNAAGAGWLVDASFDFKGGRPARVPIAVIPVWDEMRFDYGDPKKPIAAAVVPRTVMLPAEAGAVEVRSFISGHGQGNGDNCAEFCQRTHTFKVGDMAVSRMVWRTDCATSSAPNQAGNFRSSRAGWCPGAFIGVWTADVSAAVMAGQPVTVSYDVTPYENTCRPDAPLCSCGAGCAYNNNGHTLPFYELSAALIVYAR